MTHNQFTRDLAAMVTAAAVIFAAAALAGPIVALAGCLFFLPTAIVVTVLARTMARALTATDDYCGRVDQELDARRQLRAQRTVHAEPQPAPVVDLFTREPVA